MKLLGILQFEIAYQLRRPLTWLAFAILLVFSFVNTRVAIVPVTLPQDFILNSPFIITSVTVFSCQIWLLIAPGIAGEAAARDVHTGIYPLAYTTPVSKTEYLAGRFLAAFLLNAFVLLGVQLGSLLAAFGPGANPQIIGPFRPAAYLAAYVFIGLTNAFIATTVQYSAALVSGRPIAAYVGSVALFFLSYPVTFGLYLAGLGRRALMADPIGVLAIMNEMMSKWTIVEKNVRAFTLEGPMLWNRLLWLAIAGLTLVLVSMRFRFAHRMTTSRWRRKRETITTPVMSAARTDSVVAYAARDDFSTRLQQTLSIARSSFWMIVKSIPGMFLLVVFPLFLMLVFSSNDLEQWGIPLLPRTGWLLSKHMTSPLTEAADFRIMIPLLVVYFVGELVWRERDAGLSENVDTTPAPEWVFLLGKFLGVAFTLAALMVCTIAVGIVTQAMRGYYDFEIGKYVEIMFGLQLPEYLLFAALAFFLHVAVNQKYLGLIVSLLAFLYIVIAPFLGIHHKLLIYSASPNWYYTDMRGFGESVGPWAWFKGYWAAWAFLLGVAALLLWIRGRESGFGGRMRIARGRLTRATLGAAITAGALIAALGGFVFYNTNVLNEYITDDEMITRRAEYEQRFGKYEGVPQPVPTSTTLDIAIHPRQRTAAIHGNIRLINRNTTPIDSVHLEPAFYVDTRVTFDRPFKQVVSDKRLGHDIYALETPLQPGDSLTLQFDVQLRPHGFNNAGPRSSGAGRAILENGTYLTSGALPVIGYQPMRELMSADDRRKYGLPRQVTLPPPADVDPGMASSAASTFDATISTDLDQVAVAPGELRRSWTDGGRRYFHYASDIPIHGMDVFFSAKYAVHREQHNGVDLQIYLHPEHAKHVERYLRSARAALDYYSAQFGQYPWRFLQIVEQPGNFLGMGVDGSGLVTAGESFLLLDPQRPGFDMIFQVAAHEMGHQWWGMQLRPAFAEGAGVISESLAWYSAMQLVKHEQGREALRRFMYFMREPNPWPEIRTGLPLLRAMDPWANYRKGPYAFYALSEYIGEDRVNAALRTLIENKKSSLATTLDLYRELQGVTPDSLKPLLHDLFEVNAFWTFDTKKATAVQTENGAWQVALEIDAHKTVADSAGKEHEAPIAEEIEIGIFAPPVAGEILGRTLYLQRHRIQPGTQTITLTVPEKPDRAGIDPYNLLDWEEGDNIERIELRKPGQD